MSPRPSWPSPQASPVRSSSRRVTAAGSLTLTSTNLPTETLLKRFRTSFEGKRQTVPSPLYPTPLTCRVRPQGRCHRVW